MTQPDAQIADSPQSNSVVQCTHRGLFVVFHEIAPTIFESQIVVHVHDMRAIGVEMEVWVFALTQKDYELSCERAPILAARHGVGIRVFRASRFGLILSDAANTWRLWRALRKASFPPGFIHARTDYSAFICGLVRPFFGFELIWDCRGDTVAEHRLSLSNPSLLRRVLVTLRCMVMRVQRTAVRKLCTRAIFVSDALRSVSVGASSGMPFEIIPCVASSRLFHFSSELRNSVRNKLEIAPGSKVLIYSGSISFFQCFDESVALFRRVLASDPGAVFLIVTPNSEAAHHALDGIPKQNLRVLSATIADVNGFLNAADFGILLRRRDAINRVASPVKFAEYCLAGLPVIMTDAVEQSVQIGRELGNALVTELGSLPEFLAPLSAGDREDLCRRAALRLGREAAEESYRRTYGVSSQKES
ncbi:MAG TPA: hypothetical protein VK574_13735 [Terracidiphilus sp.]|nr:hypothetical protein [Terracidiphilus sp.]